jgi:hypothetical protein
MPEVANARCNAVPTVRADSTWSAVSESIRWVCCPAPRPPTAVATFDAKSTIVDNS